MPFTSPHQTPGLTRFGPVLERMNRDTVRRDTAQNRGVIRAAAVVAIILCALAVL